MRIFASVLHSLTVVLLYLLITVNSDPDPLQDLCVVDTSTTPQTFFINGSPCINPALVLSSHFTTSVLSKPGNTVGNGFGFNVTLTNIRNLPGANTQGLTMGRIDLDPNGLVPLHWHPRASEIALLVQGFILVGFVDTSNKLFTQQLRPGDSFVFPRGMAHFLYNLESSRPALVLSGLNSQNPGAEIAALAMFKSIPLMNDEVLQKSIKIAEQDVHNIRKNLGRLG